VEYLGVKRIILTFSLVASVLIGLAPSSVAAATFNVASEADGYNMPGLNSGFDITHISVAIFDNDPDLVSFYIHFKNVPRINQFNDGQGSWTGLLLDFDLDGKEEIELSFEATLKSDLNSISGTAVDIATSKFLSCDVDVFTNIDEDKTWIGFEVSRSCLGIPRVLKVKAYADYIAGDKLNYDFAPDDQFQITFNSSANSGGGTKVTIPKSGSTYALPAALLNTSTEAVNFTQPPNDLTRLTDNLMPAIVTVNCADGSGSGWSARAELSAELKSDGYRSFVVTNHHVIADCLDSKKVSLVLSDKSVIEGTIISWNESNDIAGIATKRLLPTAEWIGTAPKQGWWVGVLGSPLGQAGILTTGIISSIDIPAGTFTLTAPINPGNSGGPIFDATGRVLGLATSKNLTSEGQLAEGFGNAKGVPLLCGALISCSVEPNPWGAKSKFSEADILAKALADKTAADLKAKQEADAKALADKTAADLKAKQDADAKALADKTAADLKAKQEADAKLSVDAQTKCLNYNGDLKSLKFKISIAMTDYPLSKSKFQSLISLFPAEIDCNSIYLSTFDARYNGELRLFQNVANSYDQALKSAKELASKKKTITCVKGKLQKKVTAVNPKCPTGYKKK
jgi:hypothetical protein